MQILKDSNKEIKNIAHIADIHIRNIDRHEEYQKIFNKLYKKLNESNIDLIVIAGDIIHSKTNISPEVIELTYNLFNNLQNISPTIIIPGNHDINMTNPHRKNLLSSINKIKQLDNFYLLEDTDIYRYNNIDFYHYSLLDKNKLKHIEDKEQTNIVLYHGVVNKSKNNFGYTFESNIKTKDFKDYDIAMLGDIHKRQSLDNPFNTRIEFAGSLIQQNFGEQIEKGFLIWDIDKLKSNFIQINNDNAFYTIKTWKDDIDINVSNPRIRLFFNEDTIKEKNTIINKIRKQCSPIEISLHKEFDDYNTIVKQDNEFTNFYDINIQNKLLRTYLKERFDDITKKDINNVIQLNKKIENQLIENGKYNIPNYNNIWNIDRLEFSNMFKFGKDNVINFKKLRKGITGIFGKNNVGKTSIFEILYFSLFGKTVKKLNKLKLVNDNRLSGKTKIFLRVNNKKYIIIRKINLRKNKKGERVIENSSSGLEFYQITNDNEKIKLNDDDKFKTERKIRALLGSPDDFLNTTMVSQNTTTKFIDSKARRKRILNQMIGLEALEKKFRQAKNNFKEKEIILNDLISKNYKDEFSKLVSDINNLNNKLKKEEERYNKIDKKIDNVYNKIDNKNSLLEKSNEEMINIEKIKQKKKNIKNKIKNKNNKFSEKEEEINNKQDRIEILQNKIRKFNKVDLDNISKIYNDKIDKLDNINKNIKELQYTVKSKLKHTKILKKEPWHLEEDLCQKCSLLKDAFKSKRDLKEKHLPKSKELLKKKNKLNEELKYIRKKKEIYDQIQIWDSEIKELYNDNKILKLNKKQLEKDISLLENKLESVKSKIKEYKKNKETIKRNIKLKNEIDELNTKKDNLKNKRKQINEEITNIKSQIRSKKDRKKKVIENMDKIDELEENCNYYRYYINAMDKDNIPYQIIKNVLPKLNRKMRKLLEGTVPFTVELKANDNNDISIMIVENNGKEKPVEAEGGMANIVTGIAIRVALLQISALPKSTLFAIDEQFSAMDAEILSSVSNLMDFIKQNFRNIFMITHIESLKDIVDTIIEVTTDDEGKFSYIKIE